MREREKSNNDNNDDHEQKKIIELFVSKTKVGWMMEMMEFFN